jgi:WD40 repeat protein
MNHFKVVNCEKERTSFKNKPLKSHITCISASSSKMIVIGISDGSIYLFENFVNSPKYIGGHHETISSVVFNENLDLIVSCDNGGNILLFSVKSDRIVNSFHVENTPNEILITSHGFILLLSNNPTNTIELYDIGGRLLNHNSNNKSILNYCLCEMDDYGEFLFAAFETKECVLLRIHDLTPVGHLKLISNVYCSFYMKETMSIIV